MNVRQIVKRGSKQMELAEKDLPCMQHEFQIDFDSYFMIMSRLTLLKKLVKNRFYIFLAD